MMGTQYGTQNQFPAVDLVTAYPYTQKQELDIHKDRYLYFPMSTALAIYAADFADKNRRK
jgi:hypothetical protein